MSKLSRQTKCHILNYYRKLYINFDRKRVSEIASDCDIHETSLRNFFDIAIHEPNLKGEFDSISELVLLCTIFGSSSPYLPIQKLLSNKIKKRYYQKAVKEMIKKQNTTTNLLENKSYK